MTSSALTFPYKMEEVLSALNEKYCFSHKFYEVTNKINFENNEIKYCALRIFSDSCRVVLNEKVIFNAEHSDEDISECLMSNTKLLMVPIYLNEFVFIGFHNDNRVFILQSEIIKKYPNSVLYGYFELNKTNYSEKLILDDFSYDTFMIAHISIINPEKILIVPDHIKVLMDKHGLIDESIYFLNNKLTFEKNKMMDDFVNFVNYPGTVFFTKSDNDYRLFKQQFSNNTNIIPIQVIISYNLNSGWHTCNIVAIGILNGLLLEFRNKKLKLEQNQLNDVDINTEKLNLLSSSKNILDYATNNDSGKIFNRDELISFCGIGTVHSTYTSHPNLSTWCWGKGESHKINLEKYTNDFQKFSANICATICTNLKSIDMFYKNSNKMETFKIKKMSREWDNFVYNTDYFSFEDNQMKKCCRAMRTYIGFVHV